MVEIDKIKFEKQNLKISNSNFDIQLLFESGFCENKILTKSYFDKKIELNSNNLDDSDGNGYWKGLLVIQTKKCKESVKTCLITGIIGGVILGQFNTENKSYSVKLVDNLLIFALGYDFFAFDIERQEITWKVTPDSGGIFEFYDLEDDFLVRGELEIHRIDKKGNIKWSYGGRDIWVNIEDKKEVQIKKDKIILTDFKSNEYIINFEGKTLEDKTKFKYKFKTENEWWKFWN